MIKILTYNDYMNESKMEDSVVIEEFEKMKDDFVKNGKNLKKFFITNVFSKEMTYIYGDGNKINILPHFSYTYEHNSRMISITDNFILVTSFSSNKLFDPYHPKNIQFPTEEDKLKWKKFVRKSVIIDCSKKISGMILEYFLSEYDKLYPQLKEANVRNYRQIMDIENGKEPILETIRDYALNKVLIAIPITDLNDKKIAREFIKTGYGYVFTSTDGVKCYYVSHDKDKTSVIDPYGEEAWEEEVTLEYLSNLTHDGVRALIKNELEKYKN